MAPTSLAAVPEGDGHPAEALRGRADADRCGEVRGHRADQRPVLLPRTRAWPDRSQWVKDRRLLAAAYAVVSYPTADDPGAARRRRGPYDGKDRLGALRNVGYQAALFTVGEMRKVGLQDPDRVDRRRAGPALPLERRPAGQRGGGRGDGARLPRQGYQIGFYSTPHMWGEIVGGWRYPLPSGVRPAQRGEPEALRRCQKDWSFAGGPGVIGQWVEDGRDRNVMCPGAGGSRPLVRPAVTPAPGRHTFSRR